MFACVHACVLQSYDISRAHTVAQSIYIYHCAYLYCWLQLKPDATLILAVILLLRGNLLPMLRTVVSIIMQECISMKVVNACSA